MKRVNQHEVPKPREKDDPKVEKSEKKQTIKHVASGIRQFMGGEDYTVDLLQKRKRGVL